MDNRRRIFTRTLISALPATRWPLLRGFPTTTHPKHRVSRPCCGTCQASDAMCMRLTIDTTVRAPLWPALALYLSLSVSVPNSVTHNRFPHTYKRSCLKQHSAAELCRAHSHRWGKGKFSTSTAPYVCVIAGIRWDAPSCGQKLGQPLDRICCSLCRFQSLSKVLTICRSANRGRLTGKHLHLNRINCSARLLSLR